MKIKQVGMCFMVSSVDKIGDAVKDFGLEYVDSLFMV
jgi:hypothetical protein